MNSDTTRGLHHVTAIASGAQQNLDFHVGGLGLRLVKRTVNFDDPGTYHFYYGDESGRPGTILTFFPWAMARRGTIGSGQVTSTGLLVPPTSIGWWRDHLESLGVVAESPVESDEETRLGFLDPDGLRLDLVGREEASSIEPWSGGIVPPEHAIRAFAGVTLTVAELDPTRAVLEGPMGLIPTREGSASVRYATESGGTIDLVAAPRLGRGRIAAGSVHHVAFRAVDDDDLLAWRRRLVEAGLFVTDVRDRSYFHSIYFREPGGILFEIATDPPGFTLDESTDELGGELELPEWLDRDRDRIAALLPRLEAPIADRRSS